MAAPLYVRDDFINAGKIELVCEAQGLTGYLLVAVEISLDAAGRYNVVSFYALSDKKCWRRRESGHLRRVLPT